MLLKLRNALRGSVRAEVSGGELTRFLDRCAAGGVILWDLRREGDDRLLVSVTVPDYFTLCGLARRSACRVRAVRRAGLPFHAVKLLRRRALLTCAALCALAVWWLTGFVWTVGVTGCGQVSERAVLAYLREAGLSTGTRRRAVDSRQLRDALLLRDARIGFVTVTLTGCHAEVEVRERADTAPAGDPTPCDVVSDRAGVIVRLRVTAGRALVRVGETLLPGDRIASGTMESSRGAVWLTAARAEADVRTWRTLSAACTAQTLSRAYTGNVRVRHYLVLGTRRIALEPVEIPPFACYDKQISRRVLPLHEEFRFPVMLVTETERELRSTSAGAEETALSEALRQRLAQRLQRALGRGTVTSSSFSFAGGAPATGVVEAECVETTGVRAPLV